MSEHPVRAVFAGILLFAIGLGIGGGAVQTYRGERDRLRGWQRADGQVVELLPTTNGAARPVVGFTAAGGDRIRFTALGPPGRRTYRVGEQVPVLYPADDPSAARIDAPAVRWARSGVAGAAAVILMTLGAYVAWYARRRDAERQSAVE